MSERMMSRIHLEGGESVPVAEVVEELTGLMDRCHIDGRIVLVGEHGLCIVPLARILWVSTLPQGSGDE